MKEATVFRSPGSPLAEVRRRGVHVAGGELGRLGAWLTPLMLLLGVAALWLVLHPASR